MKSKIKKLTRILDLCRKAINSSDPSSIDSLIDDENLIEKTRDVVEDMTGKRPSEISVLEALNGLSFFIGRYEDKNGKYELKFISVPAVIVVLKRLGGNVSSQRIKVYTSNGEVR